MQLPGQHQRRNHLLHHVPHSQPPDKHLPDDRNLDPRRRVSHPHGLLHPIPHGPSRSLRASRHRDSNQDNLRGHHPRSSQPTADHRDRHRNPEQRPDHHPPRRLPRQPDALGPRLFPRWLAPLPLRQPVELGRLVPRWLAAHPLEQLVCTLPDWSVQLGGLVPLWLVPGRYG